jgi:hypothetical protein
MAREKTYESVARLERIPPWRWLPAEEAARTMGQQVMPGRAPGAVFAAAGVLLVIAAALAARTPNSYATSLHWAPAPLGHGAL